MVVLSILSVLVVLAIPIAVVVLLVGQSRLKARVALLELQLGSLAGRIPQPVAAEPTALAAAPAEPAAERVMPAAAERPSETPAQTPPDNWPRPVEPGAAIIPGPPPAPAPVDSQAIVFRADRMAALSAWLRLNWVLVVSAASLALAGVFLVQYSVQNGLLPPEARVVAAYLLGLVLVGAGEWLRRRRGDARAGDAAHIPSAFAGAGLVSIFAATLAGQQLYAMFGPELAFALHLATAAVSVVLGWYYGPFLVAFGLVGAASAPFLVSSGATPGPVLYAYYALIAATGLAVDAIRRWAWLSVLALALAFAGAALMQAGGAGQAGWLAFLVVLPLLAVALPRLSLVPDHPEPSVFAAFLAQGTTGWPEFPVRLAAGTVLAASLALLVLTAESPLMAMLVLGAAGLLALALLLWAERAEGLADLALLPAAVLPLRLLTESLGYGPLTDAFRAATIALRAPETSPPMAVTVILALATLVGLAFAYRALRGGGLALLHGLAAVLLAPLAVAVLEFGWWPEAVLGDWFWALHPLALAGLMVVLAQRFASADGADHRRMAHAALSALSLIALSLFILTSATPLTLALAVLVLVAAWLDRRFDLREMGLFIEAAIAVLSLRLLIDPGLFWAMKAPVLEVILAYGGAGLALGGAQALVRARARVTAEAALECAWLAIAAVLANVLLIRALVPPEWRDNAFDLAHISTLVAMPWLILALAQTWRAKRDPWLRRTRRIFAGGMGIGAGLGLTISALPLNPLFFTDPGDYGALVKGPWLADTLALAYALPALVLLGAAWKLPFSRRLRLILLAGGAGLMANYIGLEIRRYWRGDWLGQPGVTEPELYSYTIALMVLGAGLLWQAIARRSHLLRRIAMTVIALVIAKVFLIDAAGLTGLTRVFSFLGLGLSLAGLAFVNRWADRQLSKEAPP